MIAGYRACGKSTWKKRCVRRFSEVWINNQKKSNTDQDEDCVHEFVLEPLSLLNIDYRLTKASWLQPVVLVTAVMIRQWDNSFALGHLASDVTIEERWPFGKLTHKQTNTLLDSWLTKQHSSHAIVLNRNIGYPIWHLHKSLSISRLIDTCWANIRNDL